MKLHEFDFKNPMLTSIYCERYINDSKGKFSEFSDVNPIFDPQGTLPIFYVPFTWIPRKDLEIYESSPSKELLMSVTHSELGLKFLWHPDCIRPGLKIDGYTEMQPTSSTRTMLEMQSQFFYVKTDLDKKHFRFVRRLKKGSVSHSIEICNDLRELANTLSSESTYSFLPESLGFVVTYGEHKESGVLFRESKPFPYCDDNRIIIPYHSLYANDQNDLESLPLLVQLCNKHAPQEPLEFFVEYIVGLIQDAWVLLVTERGLLPELHGQNALIEIDENFFPRRVVHRDFQGTYSDSEIRMYNKLKLFNKHVVGEETGTTIRSQYSHVFDGMIGRYLLARLTRSFCAYFTQYDYKIIASKIAERFHKIPNNQISMFPETTFKFGNSANEQNGNNVVLVDSGIYPDFR